MVSQDQINAARSACIDIRTALEDHAADPQMTGLKAIDPEAARQMAWALAKTARMLLEDDDDRDEETTDRAAVLFDECEDILRATRPTR